MISGNPKSYFGQDIENKVILLIVIQPIKDPAFFNINYTLHWLPNISHISLTVFIRQFEAYQKLICLFLQLFIPTLNNTYILIINIQFISSLFLSSFVIFYSILCLLLAFILILLSDLPLTSICLSI